jgi:hypothetical protein
MTRGYEKYDARSQILRSSVKKNRKKPAAIKQHTNTNPKREKEKSLETKPVVSPTY